MRIGRISKYFLLFILISISYVNTSSDSEVQRIADTVLVTQILDMSLLSSVEGGGYTEYIFEVVGEVWNSDANSITIEHPNTCGFGVFFNPIKVPGETAVYSSFACGDAITPITYSPGSTNYSTFGGIIAESSTSTSLPDGVYEITLGDPSTVAYLEKVTLLVTFMSVTNGEVSFEFSPPTSDWSKTIDSSFTSFESSTTTISDSKITESKIDQSTETSTLPISSTSSEGTDTQKENEKPEVVSETLNFNFATFLIGFLFLTGFRVMMKRYN